MPDPTFQTADNQQVQAGDRVYEAYLLGSSPRIEVDILTYKLTESHIPEYVRRNYYSHPLAAKIAAGRQMIKRISEQISDLEAELLKVQES